MRDRKADQDRTPDPDIDETEATRGAGGMSRRILLTRSSLGLAAAGVAGLMPAVPVAIAAAETDAPDAQATVAEGESLVGPIVAQVKNLETGEVSIFSGLREISVFDRGLAARLFNAAK